MTAGQLGLIGMPEPERPTAAKAHPAQFHDAILAAVRPTLRRWSLPVHDPFAGPGVKLGRLCDELGLVFTGTDLESAFLDDSADWRVRHGDSVDPSTYPSAMEYCIFTSPTYPNGMSDHWQAQDSSKRMTYVWAVEKIIGYYRPLHPNNTGRFTIRNGSKKAAREYWRLCRSCVDHWPDRAVVNVKDCGPYKGKLYPLVDLWAELLVQYGYEVVDRVDVETPGNKFSPNRDRAETEAVLVARRP